MSVHMSDPRVEEWTAPRQPKRISFAVSGGSPQEFEATLTVIKGFWYWPRGRSYDSVTHRWTVTCDNADAVETLRSLFSNWQEHWDLWTLQEDMFAQLFAGG